MGMFWLLIVALQRPLAQGQDEAATLLYPFGPEHGDQSVPRADDGYSPKFLLSEPFSFFGVSYRGVYVNTNGLVSFEVPVSQFTPRAFPLADGRAFVAPFWADVTTVKRGQVWYRETQQPGLLSRASRELATAFPDSPVTVLHSLFVATWDRVPFYGSRTHKANTFQAVLASGTNASYILLYYGDIQWTTGVASGGSPNDGLGGTPAQVEAGFNSGTAQDYFNIPGSRTSAIIHITSTSNVGIPGLWAFRTDNFIVPSGCIYKAQFLPIGATFWNSSTCGYRCKCLNEQKVQCWPEPCQAEQRCRASYPFSYCQALPGPSCQLGPNGHLRTFSGHLLHLQPCAYILAQASGNVTGFQVKVESKGTTQTPRFRLWLLAYGQEVVVPNDTVGHVLGVLAIRGDTHIARSQSVRAVTNPPLEALVPTVETGQGEVNGLRFPMPIQLLQGSLTAHVSGSATYLTTDFGLELWVQEGHLELTVPAALGSTVRGLCGAEALTPSGTSQPEPTLLVTSWQTAESCGRAPPSCPPEQMALYTGHETCGLLEASPGPFTACAHVLSPRPFVESCAEELCTAEGEPLVLCQALAAYARSCQAANLTVGVWRSQNFCEISCPENSHYEACTSPCGASCLDSLAPLFCKGPCREGCACDAGHLLSGGACIPQAHCGCSLHGRYFPVGARVLTDHCRQRCTCEGPGQPVHCQPYACKVGEVCKVQDGVWGCIPGGNGSIWVSGDPHYRTFDGVAFTAQGACHYTLTRSCRAGGEPPAFAVHVYNEYLSSIAVAWTRQVEVVVYGERIVMTAKAPGKVQVNGLKRNLPLHLAGGRIQIYFSGSGAVLQTDIGLLVSYDWRHYVSVMVPETYAGSLCGLGGDFNGNPEDDFRGPGGTLLPDAHAFVESWKDPGSPVHCSAMGPTPRCTREREARYRSQDFCGLLGDRDGPFRACDEAAEAWIHVENCVHDLCASEVARRPLCEALRSYAQQCQRQGLPIEVWRHRVGCEMACPTHSHYELCGSSCPNSCTDRTLANQCQTPCQEGCQCDPGFVLSGTDCVPPTQCGCTSEGRYYLAGETFWEGEGCRRFCHCDASTHEVHCFNTSCGPGERCGTLKGIFGCHPLAPSTCRLLGQSQYITFEGKTYNFPGTCKYIFSELCGSLESLPSFRVEVKKESRPSTPISVISEVLILINRTKIHLHRKNPGLAEVDGETLLLPLNLNSGGIILYPNGFYLTLWTDFGLTLSSDLAHSLFLSLPPRYEGNTCGLCGNFSWKGDLQPQKRTLTRQLVDSLASRWKTEDCEYHCAPDGCPACVEQKQLIRGKARCWILQDPRGPFSACHAEIDPEPYVASCANDMCLSMGNSTVLCLSIQTYAAACHRAHITVGPWRNASFCTPACPAHSYYHLCQDPHKVRFCAAVPLPLPGSPVCSEGCICFDGYLWSGDRCVRPDECGCEHEGRYHKVGELVWLSHCTQRCSCDGPGRFRCALAQCPEGETCALQAGRLGCQNPMGICTATGDPHYLTFDGAVAHFQGTCAYQLTHTCKEAPPPGGLSFRVEATNRNFRSRRVSFVTHVEVWLSNRDFKAHVVLERGQPVKVDGHEVSLPVLLGPQARVGREQGLLLLRVGGELEVQYNGRNTLFVRVGPGYRGRLCGMCGNFNGDKKDDKILPGGGPAPSDAAFGNAWQADASPPGCRKDFTGTELCHDRHRVERLCATLSNRSGPFAECHWHEKPDPYVQSCVYDLCQYGTGNRMLCAALEAYAELCALHRVRLPDWRAGIGCNVACPPNSYYDFCGSPCQVTCANLNTSVTCTRPCTAGCFCQEGYVLENGICVPRNHCGCVLNGQYYPLGAEVLLTDTCSQKCTCQGPGLAMECHPHACGPREVCRLRGGVRGCYPIKYGTMWLYGDPHVQTFDGVTFSFRGACRVALVQTCDTHLTPFAIWLRAEHQHSIVASWAKQVDVDIGGERFSLLAGQHKTVQVNGSQMNLPLVLAGGRLHAFSSPSGAVLWFDFGLSLSFDESHSLWVSVPETYAGSLCGLAGDFNGNPKDDFRGPDGALILDADTFADSWREPGFPNHCSVVGLAPQCPPEKEAQYQSPASCGLLQDQDGPFSACHEVTEAHIHMENCIRDVCASESSQEILCEVLASYSKQCQWHGLSLQPWRHQVGCEMACPTHSHYELCGSSCPNSCAEPNLTASCQTPCQEGCQCDPGFVLSGTDCVPPAQCGCTSEGRYYLAGETFWEGEGCRRFCHCDASTHEVHCSHSSCAPGERCGTLKGIFGCHLLAPSTCQTLGQFQYMTFDQRTLDFLGACKYVFSELCGSLEALPFFRVEVRKKDTRSTPISVISEVLILINGTQIHLQEENLGLVHVNGVTFALPLSLNMGAVLLYQDGLHLTLQTDFGLVLISDLAHSLFLTLPPDYMGRTCGLCGNFNGDAHDDFQMQTGSPVGDPVTSSASEWKPEDDCKDNCANSCPVCVAPEQLVPAKAQCWILQDPRGPFSSCHMEIDPEPFASACANDLCLSMGNSHILCLAIQTYAAACQRANVTIGAWRSPSFCAPRCPQHSHYDLCACPRHRSCPGSELKCGLLCAEGCVCDDGHQPRGYGCIPAPEHSCSHQGRHCLELSPEDASELLWRSWSSHVCLQTDHTGQI
ncbi:IgGFc-binding protein-like [Dromiciops gliroides]|uniref:IgGFc-binding protein-like n=1 Tax=Dromiciops gliroides TaxID=33562 RepID=UPI001CC482EF|nr:IgGFc-binding protein-like [Dromiciops gliroides]